MDVEVLTSKFTRTFPTQAGERQDPQRIRKRSPNRPRPEPCTVLTVLPSAHVPAQVLALLLPMIFFIAFANLIAFPAHKFGTSVSLAMASRVPTFFHKYACSLT